MAELIALLGATPSETREGFGILDCIGGAILSKE